MSKGVFLMGWTFYNAKHFKRDGVVDRKAELDNLYTSYNAEKQIKHTVLKSAMVGTTYYAAVEVLSQKTRDVYAVVVLTSSDKAHGYNFGYKDIDETMGPCECKCPSSILNLLTVTNNQYANEWRNKCVQYNANKGSKTLSSLPIGTQLKITVGDESLIIVKRPPMYQFKRAWWYIPSENKYCKLQDIPDDYEIIFKPDT